MNKSQLGAASYKYQYLSWTEAKEKTVRKFQKKPPHRLFYSVKCIGLPMEANPSLPVMTTLL